MRLSSACCERPMNVMEKINMNTCAKSVHGGAFCGADGEMSPKPEQTNAMTNEYDQTDGEERGDHVVVGHEERPCRLERLTHCRAEEK